MEDTDLYENSTSNILKQMRESALQSNTFSGYLEETENSSNLEERPGKLPRRMIKSIQKEIDTLRDSLSLLRSLRNETMNKYTGIQNQWSPTREEKQKRSRSSSKINIEDLLNEKSNSKHPAVNCSNSRPSDSKENLMPTLMVDLTPSPNGVIPIKELNICLIQKPGNDTPCEGSIDESKENQSDLPSTNDLNDNTRNTFQREESIEDFKVKAMSYLPDMPILRKLKDKAMGSLPNLEIFGNGLEKATGSFPYTELLRDKKETDEDFLPNNKEQTISDVKSKVGTPFSYKDICRNIKEKAMNAIENDKTISKSREILDDVNLKAKSMLCENDGVEDGDYLEKPFNYLYHRLRSFCRMEEDGVSGSLQEPFEDDAGSICPVTKKT